MFKIYYESRIKIKKFHPSSLYENYIDFIKHNGGSCARINNRFFIAKPFSDKSIMSYA